MVPDAAAVVVSCAELVRPTNSPMEISSPPLTCVHFWRRPICALAALLFLAGCGAKSDFGEVNPVLVRDDIHDWVGPYAVGGTQTPSSSFELTEDERQLRDLAYPLIEPPYNRQQWYSVAAEYGMLRGDRHAAIDRSVYASKLLSSRYRSSLTRYSQLIDDIRNDTTNMPQFFEAAARVRDIDQKRQKSLAYISELSASERGDAFRRIKENASIVSLVRTKLSQRVAGYRFALERLVVATPSPQAVEVERALNELQSQIARYRTRSAPSWVREQSLASTN